MNTSGTYKIRPAGRHLLTIGRDLIQNYHAAVVELVKNAYDADSPDVHIKFRITPDSSGYTFAISDQGHGMSRNTVINQWMVPSTADKKNRRKSPCGRIMQGRKGVGRYAASILGTDLRLETVTAAGEKTTVLVEWKDFENAQYLDDVEIAIETTMGSDPPGTKLTITGDDDFLAEWNHKQFNKLRFELKKLKSPVSVALSNEHSDDQFQIRLTFTGFSDEPDGTETIEPYPIFDLFDYRIAGTINTDGKGSLTYSQQKIRNTTEENICFDTGRLTDCGEMDIDIRVYDRDKEAIDALIQRGLIDDSGNYVGKLKARQILDKSNGIGVYRNGFRIRPLGDDDFDWLKLDSRRVQNPSMRIGNNQAIGYVHIQPEELSGLVEKSARDGLRENPAFSRLKKIVHDVITELETRRFRYRKQAGVSRPVFKVEQQIERLFSSDELKRNIQTKLSKAKVDNKTVGEVIEIISLDVKNKNRIADEIRQAVAVYQGQATLGKIINVVLHEGRRPLSYFRNQIPNLRYWHKTFLKTKGAEGLEEIMSIADGLGNNAEFFVKLFNRLDPLAAGKRPAKKPLNLKKVIEGALSVFEGEMKAHPVVTRVNAPDDFRFWSWSQDIYAVFTNLADNSLYWMHEKNISRREINIEVVTDGDSLDHIDYRDTGPGIEPALIASEVIFEPHFSTKPAGAGLGLAIAGEAAIRNGLELKAFESESGVWFRLQSKTGDEK